MPKLKPKSKAKSPKPVTKTASSRGSAKASKGRAAKRPATKQSTKISRQTTKKPETRKSKPPQDGGTSKLRREHLNPRDLEAMRSKIQAANFGNIVSVLMQSSLHKDKPLSELAHLVVPPLLNNQFHVAEAQNKETGFTVPAAMALWACVSEDVDKRLVENVDKPFRLTAKDWNSGDILWLIEMIGDTRFIAPMLKRMNENVFKGNPVKYRTVNAEGVASIVQLNTSKT